MPAELAPGRGKLKSQKKPMPSYNAWWAVDCPVAQSPPRAPLQHAALSYQWFVILYSLCCNEVFSSISHHPAPSQVVMDHEMCKYYIRKRTRLEKCLTGLAVYELAEISLCMRRGDRASPDATLPPTPDSSADICEFLERRDNVSNGGPVQSWTLIESRGWDRSGPKNQPRSSEVRS